MTTRLALAATFCLLASIATPAQALVIDDFSGLAIGPINGQNGWTADAAATVGRDLTRGGDEFLRLRGAANDIYKSLGAAAIPQGQTGTIFFQFMASTSIANHGIGITEIASPTAWSAYRATALMIGDGRDVKMQGRSNTVYADLALNGGANGLAPLAWHDAWIVVNNSADTADFYLRRNGSTERVLVGSGLPFRNGATTASLGTFLARVNDSGTLDDVLLDNVHAWIGGVDAGVAPSPKAGPSLDVPAVFDFAATRLAAVHSNLTPTQYPTVTTTAGAWSTTAASSWTSGFYPGMLWQMHARTGETAWRDAAVERMAGIESQKTNDGTHDLGFMVGIPFISGYAQTGNTAYRDVAITASNTLATRYNGTVGAIQSWGDKTTGNYDVIIDNMMNLEMLFWSAKNGGPASLYDIAVQHALTSRDELVRPDGSTYHVVRFDRTTGDVIEKRTHQGYSNDSTWSRGQAWGVYGFTATYRETGDARFLETAQALADYFIDHAAETGVPYYDFQDPANQPPWDSSAAAVAAAGLLELMNYVDAADRQRYFQAAEQMLLTLAGPTFLSDGTTFDSLLMHGTVSKTGLNRVGTSYGDYYFLEALGRYEAVPEPSTLALLACGIAGLILAQRRRLRVRA